MKATGIVRRIDDLGRVVIPKEIRRTMRIREGDPLEIYTEKDGEVIFKKYSPMGELSEFAGKMCETLAKASGCITAITDRDSVIAVSGVPKRELMEKSVTHDIEQIMENRKPYQRNVAAQAVLLVDGVDKYVVSVVSPIITEGDVMGSVVFLSTDLNFTPGDVEIKLAQTVSGFLGKQMES